MRELQTARLTIRALASGDSEPLVRVLRVPGEDRAERERVARYVRYNELANIVLAELGQPPYGDRAVLVRETGALAGLAGLVPAYVPFDQLREPGTPAETVAPAWHRPELGLFYEIDPDQRGRGYATEAAEALVRYAFDDMRCARVVATTEHTNLASQAVMRKLGMRILENPLPEPPWLQAVGVIENPRPPSER
jgi:[ribosomal protein S5]-alanine N-acetyltransferase